MTSVRKGFMYLLAGSAGQSVLRVVFTAVLARLLSPTDFGLMATATIITGFAEIFVQFGFGQGLVQKLEITRQDVGTAYTSSLVIGLLFGGGVVFTAQMIATFFDQPELTPILRWLAILFPIKSINQVQFSILQRALNFKALAGRDMISYFVGYGMLGIYLAYMDFGVYSLVSAVLVQAILYSFLLGIIQKEYGLYFSFNKSSFHHLFEFGKNITLSKIWNYLALKGDYFIVGKFLGVHELGFYSRAYGLMNFPNNILGKVFNTVLFPHYSKHQDNRKKLSSHIKKLIDTLFILGIPVTIGAYLTAEDMVLILLGKKWTNAILPFQYLCTAIVFRIGYKINNTLLKSIGRVKTVSNIQLSYFVFVIISSFIGVQFGIEYVALGVSISIVVVFLISMRIVFGYIDYSFKDLNHTIFKALLFAFCLISLPGLIYLQYMEVMHEPIFRLLALMGMTSLIAIFLLISKRVSIYFELYELRERILLMIKK